MTEIKLETLIYAPVQRCYDLSRSIDLHKLSTQKTEEEAIAGKTRGLIDLGETVTWRARHFGVMQKMTVKITAVEAPFYFQDEMIKGIFQSFSHEHFFAETGQDTCLMQDRLLFEVPLGFLGRLAEKWVLKDYLQNLLIERNEMIKAVAESEQWRELPEMV